MRIAVKPTSPAEVAAKVSLISAYFLGLLAAVSSMALSFVAGIAGIDDPFINISRYLGTMYSFSFTGIALMLLPFWFFVLGIFLSIGTLLQERGAFLCKVVMLLPMVVCIPMFIWSVDSALACFQQEVINIPPWLDSPLIRIWGSREVFFAIVAIAIAFAIHAARRFGEFPEHDEYPTCAYCRYNLTGNVSGVCPECGKPVPAKQAELNK